jgi:hypothetical protein
VPFDGGYRKEGFHSPLPDPTGRGPRKLLTSPPYVHGSLAAADLEGRRRQTVPLALTQPSSSLLSRSLSRVDAATMRVTVAN